MGWKQTMIRYKLHHLLFWIVVGAIWFYLRYQDYSTVQKAVQVTLIKVLDLALLIYLANYLLIPKLLYRKRYLLFALCFIGMIALSSAYKMYIIGKLLNNPALMSFSGNLKARIYDNVIPHFFLVIAGVAFKLLLDYTKVQKRLAEVAKEKAEAELSFLKSQINPHFLFNSLNAVYFLIDKTNTEARQALHQFSEMLRYQLYELKDEKIPIEKEIGYLKDYVQLQRLRRDEHYRVALHIDEDIQHFFIEPLLLIPFVENSFKHLSNYTDGRLNEVSIDLSKKNGEMKFEVRNTTEGKQQEQNTGGGIGLANVKRRLELLYPQKHELKIEENNGWFHIQLAMKINS
jgi:two-component system LytT family sensor kinase